MTNQRTTRKLLSVLVSLAMITALFSGLGITASAAPSGDWTDSGNYDISWYTAGQSAYTLSDAGDLAGLAYLVNNGTDTFIGDTITLSITESSLDLSAHYWIPIGTATIGSASTSSPQVTAGNGFAGTFNGGGYTISGLSITDSQNGVGLFQYLEPAGTISSLAVSGTVNISGSVDAVAGVVGYNSGTITNVVSSVAVTAGNAYNVGGIAGFNNGYYKYDATIPAPIGIIANSVNVGNISGFNKVGGIVGENSGTIVSCYNTGTIQTSSPGNNRGVGGIVGRNGNNNTPVEVGFIANCYNTGAIGNSGTGIVLSWVGGMAGFNNGTSFIYNCYDTGNVFGSGYTNPIAGNQEGYAYNCYSLQGLNATGSTPAEIGTVMTTAQMQATSFSDTLNANAGATSGIWTQTSGNYPDLARSVLPSAYTVAMTTAPSKLSYITGDMFDATGMVLTVTPTGGGASFTTSSFALTAPGPLTISNTTETVYTVAANTVFTTSFGITVSTPGVINTAGTYYLTNTARFPDGPLQITTTGAVTLIGGGTSSTSTSRDLNIAYNVSGANLTLENVFISTASGSAIDFTGTGNNLTINSENILEATGNDDAAIHVPPTSDLTIAGAGTLYVYKNALAAGIGGDSTEVNGTITINDIDLFLKGSRTGAGIGTGANSGTTTAPGVITINDSQVNLVTVSRGAALGGGVGGTIGTINIVDSSVNIVCDFNGAAIGVGDSAATAGTVNLTNSSLYTSATDDRTSTAPLVTANVYQAGQTVNLYEADVASIPNGTFTVNVDGAAYVTGTVNTYSYSENTSYTPGNWASSSTGTIGVWLTGADQLINVNGTYYKATWNSTDDSFNTSGAIPHVTMGGGGYSDLSSALTALNALGTDGVLEIAGSASIGTATIALTANQAIARAPGYTGNLLTINGGESLTITSGVIDDSAANTSIRVNSGSTFTITPTSGSPFQIGGIIYLESGRYITLTAVLPSNIIVSMANPAIGALVAMVGDFDIAEVSAPLFQYAGGGHDFEVDSNDNISIAS
jgi:hypothetical protein